MGHLIQIFSIVGLVLVEVLVVLMNLTLFNLFLSTGLDVDIKDDWSFFLFETLRK